MFSRTSRILLVIALLAAGAYLLIERPRERKEDKKENAAEQLASFDMASIDSITIERKVSYRPDGARVSEDPLVFTRAGSSWRATVPFQDSADPGAMGTLLDALRTADINRHLGNEQDLAPFGLKPPDAIVTLMSAHHQVLQVEIGKNTVDNAWCYAREPNGEVLLVPTDVHRSSTLPADAYRNHRVLDFEVADVTGYTIKNPHSTMEWQRRGDAWYALAGRDSVEGDSIAVTAPLHRLRGLRVAQFYGSEDFVRLPEDSVHTMTLFINPDRRAELRFDHVKSGWLVRQYTPGGSGAATRIMSVGDDLSDLFAHSVNELRERRLLQFDPAVTHRINFASPSSTGELVRSGGLWSYPNPVMGRVDPKYASDFVRALRALKWSEPGNDVARGTGRVYYRIEIMGEGDKMIDQLTAGPLDASTSWVTSRSSRGTWLVENARLDEVANKFARLKQR
ncbi:MAG TPA: DUF4340 domain-containing protein [Candidatus Krumholzibacteria bacterium]|nr:DUF4340 domain-containing protein [Candidatus Krumholzibacteria bacterium]